MLKTFKKEDKQDQYNINKTENTGENKEINYKKRNGKPSIYKTIQENVNSDGTLNVQRIEEELWKFEELPNAPIYVAGFRDNLKTEAKEVNTITGILILEKIFKRTYETVEEFEDDFHKLETTAKEFLNFLHLNIQKMKPDLKVLHDFMARVLISTLDIEVFKIAFEIVGNLSDENSEASIFTVGQYPEFTRYLTMILFNKGKLNEILELMSRTEGWGKVSILELLAFNDLVKDDVEYQANLIKSTYSGKFVLSIETDPIIGHNFDLSKLLDMGLEDRELFLDLVNIINISVEGGAYTSLLNTENGREKFLKFIHTVKNVKFDYEKLIAYLILYRIFKYVPNELLEKILESDFNYEEIRTEIKEYLDNNFTEELVKEIFTNENEFFLLDYAMDYDKYFVLDIVKNKYSGNLYNYNYLNLVLEMGNKEQKRELLEKFREDYNIEDRQKEKFSLETKPEWSYDEKYRYDGVLSLIMANLNKLSIDEEYNDMEYGLFDFNPQIRHASLLALLAVKDYKMIPEIGLQIKRLLAETPHVRDAAMEVMTKYNLSLKQNEYDEIISKLGDKIDDEGKNKLSNYIN